MRHEVTIRIMVDASNKDEAHAKCQKLCDTINEKDPRNKAWIPKIVIDPKGQP